jgi:hypothetical protein
MFAVLISFIILLVILGGLMFYVLNRKPIISIPPPTDNPLPPTDKPPTDKPPTDKPPTDKPPADKPPTDKPTDKPPTDKPTDKPPTDKPPTDKPPTNKPPTNGYNQNCYYNAAYEDKDKMDKIEDIEKNVKGCYILVEPDELNITRVKQLQAKNNKLGCYMSVGTVEDNRPDFSKFKKGTDYVEQHMTDWTDEYVIKGDSSGNPTSNTVNLMKQRIDKLADLNCDYIELDNMDADQEDYTKKYKTNLTSSGMKKYTSGLCNYIHNHPKRKMKCVFKNENSSDYTQFDALQLELDANENPSWDDKFIKHFIDNKKPVWVSQYGKKSSDECKKSFEEINKKYGNGFGMACSVYGNDNKYYHYGGGGSP